MADDSKTLEPLGVRAMLGDDPLEGVETLVKGAVGEIGRMLDSNQVVGEPIRIGNATVIPLVSMGFGFGAGGGGGGDHKGHGGGGGAGGGGGTKPVGLIIVDEAGVRLEPIPENPSSLGQFGAALADALRRRRDDDD